MKKLLFVLMILPALVFCQPPKKQTSNVIVKTANTSGKTSTDSIARLDTRFYDSLKDANAKQSKPTMDSIVGVVTYHHNDRGIQTDTAVITVKSTKGYVFENLGQYDALKKDPPLGVSFVGRYMIVRDIKVARIVRTRNGESLNRHRVISTKFLRKKK